MSVEVTRPQFCRPGNQEHILINFKMGGNFCYKAFIGDRDSSLYLVTDRTRLYNPMTMKEMHKLGPKAIWSG